MTKRKREVDPLQSLDIKEEIGNKPEDAVKLSFALRINELLTNKEMQHIELATDAKILPSSLNNYLHGKNEASITALYKISQALCSSSDFLIGLAKEPNPDPDYRAISTLTGLSNRSVDNLQELQKDEHYKSNIAILNYLMESQYIYYLIDRLRESIQLTEYLKQATQKGDEISENYANKAIEFLEWQLSSFFTIFYKSLLSNISNSKYFNKIINEGLEHLDDDIRIALLENIEDNDEAWTIDVTNINKKKTDGEKKVDSEMIISNFLRSKLGIK